MTVKQQHRPTRRLRARRQGSLVEIRSGLERRCGSGGVRVARALETVLRILFQVKLGQKSLATGDHREAECYDCRAGCCQLTVGTEESAHSVKFAGLDGGWGRVGRDKSEVGIVHRSASSQPDSLSALKRVHSLHIKHGWRCI